MQFHAARNQAMQFCAARNQTNQWRHRNETVTVSPWGHQTYQQVSLQGHLKKGRWTPVVSIATGWKCF